ncbi:MAG: hypothetical protein QXJ17_00725 [Nitrososphaeria archaeon]
MHKSSVPRIRVYQNSQRGFELMVCTSCEEKYCLKACGSGAIFIDPLTGSLAISKSLCTKCMRCVYACIDNGILYDFNKDELLCCDKCWGSFYCALICPMGAIGKITLSEPLKVTQNF